MLKVYSNEHVYMSEHIKNLLEQNGIHCFLQNEHLSAGIGELPPIECWSEVWIEDDADHARTRAIIEAALAAQKNTQSAWTCHCGEAHTGCFLSCWHCGADRPTMGNV